MRATTFAVPIMPGKTEAWKKAMSEITGPRKKDHDESRKRLGIAREVASLQTFAGRDYAVVCIEAEDPDTVVARYLKSTTPFDRWFAETVLKETHGMGASDKPTGSNDVFLDWKA